MDQNAIVTFDYEVFLGRKTGTVENCVIKPVKLILDILKKNKAKAIFFVDVPWLLFLKKNYPNDFREVEQQLNEICKSNSSVELHIHPQWINAVKTINGIEFTTFNNYNLRYFNDEEILDLFKMATELLQIITGCKIRCFRAGGWCIEPFIRVKEAFETFNIKYDFSVVPGVRLNEEKIFDYDFSAAPRAPYYRFQTNVNKADEKGSFVEVPLSTYRNLPFYRILNKGLLILSRDKIYGDGTGIKEKTAFNTFSGIFSFSKRMLTLDKTSNIIFKYLVRTHFHSTPLIVAVSHPKAVSGESLKNLEFISGNYNTLNSEDLANSLIIN